MRHQSTSVKDLMKLRQKARQRRDKRNISRVGNHLTASVRQVENSTIDALGRERENYGLSKLRSAAGTNEMNATVGRPHDGPNLLENHSAFKSESKFISSGYVRSLQAYDFIQRRQSDYIFHFLT